jgi:hypothetical protein
MLAKGSGGWTPLWSDKIAGSDFERPQAGPQGGAQGEAQ